MSPHTAQKHTDWFGYPLIQHLMSSSYVQGPECWNYHSQQDRLGAHPWAAYGEVSMHVGDKYRALLWRTHTPEDWGLSPVHTEPLTSRLLPTSCHLSWLTPSWSPQFTHQPWRNYLSFSEHGTLALSCLCSLHMWFLLQGNIFLENLHPVSLSSGKTSSRPPDTPTWSSLWPLLVAAASGQKCYGRAYATQHTVVMILCTLEHLHITVLYLYTSLSGASRRPSQLSDYSTGEVKTLKSGVTVHSFKS